MCSPRRFLSEGARWPGRRALVLDGSRLPEALATAFEALNGRYAVEAGLGDLAGLACDELAALAAARADVASALAARPAWAALWVEAPLVVVEVTWRTQGGRMALTPTPAVCAMVHGILGRAQAATGTHIFGLHALTNHLSLLVGVRTCDQLADFTCRVGGQTSQRVGDAVGLRALGLKLWHRRNRSIVVDATDEDCEKAMRYSLANAVKEGLVAHASEWPGAHAAAYFCGGAPLVGTWLDNTAWQAALRKDASAPRAAFERPYAVVLSKLPGLAHLSDLDYEALMRRWCDEAAEQARLARVRGKLPPLCSLKRLLSVPIHARPADFVPTPAPPVHASNPERRRAFLRAYRDHVEAQVAERARLRAIQRANGALPAGEAICPLGWQPPAKVAACPSLE